ncbi:sensor histidine kinase [Paenibacillus macquariensis]|uniref:sensor histidine kinase n=1 Tax=Paenibacillus macquariensis TaxID=948756 RepID=UPI001FCD0BF1|nr:GHKL domain-containing protein [Paenibacillus macquariensis]MEC0090298.1 GHKL domain-containing protein [Paenibacillus macquariensis]
MLIKIINPIGDYLDNQEVINVFVVSVLALILSQVGRYLFSKFKGHEMFFKRYGVLFTVLSVVTIVIFYVNILIGKQQGFSDENLQANSFLFLFYFVLLLIVFVVLTRMVNKEAKMHNKQLQYERLTEYTKNLEGLYTDMQKFRHDYINILLTMSEYIRTKDIENLDSYFTNKILPISQGMQSDNYKLGTLQNVKVQEVKGILSSKIIRAQELNIDGVIEVVEPIETLNMDSIKLCRCLGIILDNATEEALQCVAPSLRVALIKREGTVLIVTTNSCRPNGPELYKIYEKGFSTKGTNRGLGLSNLKEIVSQCDNVTLDTYIKDDLFVQELEIFE